MDNKGTQPTYTWASTVLHWEGIHITCNAGDTEDMGFFPVLGRFPGVGNSNPFQYSCQENPMDREPGGLQTMELQSRT